MAAIVGGIIGAILVVLVIVLIVVYLRKKKDRTEATLFPPERAMAMRVMSDPYSIDPACIKVLRVIVRNVMCGVLLPSPS